MSDSATSILDKIAPQFAADGDKAWFVSQARRRTNTCVFGVNTELAVAYRAAHMMTKRDIAGNTGGSGGSLASKREGDLAVSFQPSSSGGSGASDLNETSYGNDLLGLIKGNIPAVGVTGGNDDGCGS